MTNTKTMTATKTMTKKIQETCDVWDTEYNSDNLEHDNLCALTINSDTGQHLQFLQCLERANCQFHPVLGRTSQLKTVESKPEWSGITVIIIWSMAIKFYNVGLYIITLEVELNGSDQAGLTWRQTHRLWASSLELLTHLYKSRADEDGGGESPPVGWTYCTGTSFWVKPLETTWFYFSWRQDIAVCES